MAGNADKRPFEIKTSLSENHYQAMLEVCEALGLTQAGYVRQLILNDIVEKRVLVEQLTAIVERPKKGKRRA